MAIAGRLGSLLLAHPWAMSSELEELSKPAAVYTGVNEIEVNERFGKFTSK